MDNKVLDVLPEDQLVVEDTATGQENPFTNNNPAQDMPSDSQPDAVDTQIPVNVPVSDNPQTPADDTQPTAPDHPDDTSATPDAPVYPVADDNSDAEKPVADAPAVDAPAVTDVPANDDVQNPTASAPVDPQTSSDVPAGDNGTQNPADQEPANVPNKATPDNATNDPAQDDVNTINISAPVDDQNTPDQNAPSSAEDGVENKPAADNGCGDHPCDKKWVDNNGTGEKVIITGTDQDDVIHGTALAEDISGRAGDDKLYSGPGDDVLDGEAGNDAMYGCHGDDVYYVDSEGDKVIEFVNQGNDHVFSSISYTLPENVENVHLMTDDDLNAVGNELDNVLHGNDGKNDLSGGAGNDNLYGHAGDDILDGESGADFMVGGEGNDIYYVDQAGDTVVECADEGMDTVLTSISYTAGDHVENLTLLGDDDLNLTGNELNNLLHGNDGNNILLGGDGCDQVFAHDGNDILDGGTGNDLLNGGSGFDTYLFGRGYGNDTIVDYDQSEISNDRISFGRGISADDLELSRSGGDLVIGLKDSDDSLTISQWFDNADYQIEEFLFNNGDAWSYEQIQEATQALYTTVSANSQLDDIQQQAQTAGSGL